MSQQGTWPFGEHYQRLLKGTMRRKRGEMDKSAPGVLKDWVKLLNATLTRMLTALRMTAQHHHARKARNKQKREKGTATSSVWFGLCTSYGIPSRVGTRGVGSRNF